MTPRKISPKHQARHPQILTQTTSSATETPEPTPPATPTFVPTAAKAAFPAHREWPDLSTLNLSSLIERLDTLKERCATARTKLNASLLHLNKLIKAFTGPQDLTSSSSIAAYLTTYLTVLDYSLAIFPLQEAYRNAITTLGLFVTDLVDELPEESALRKRLRREFDEGMVRADRAEDGVREGLVGLGKGVKGEEWIGLGVYMRLVWERVGSWGGEEKRMGEWGRECVEAMK